MTVTNRQRIDTAEALRAYIHALAIDNPDPRDITNRILDSLSADEAAIIASVALHDYVRRTIVKPTLATGRSYETKDGRSTPSRKIAAIRDWVAAELRTSVCIVTSAGNEWKHLGECSAAELRALAVERDRKAAQVAAEGKRFAACAQAVESAGVDSLGELDRATLEAVLR